jgi:hypothetical protein
MASLFAGWLACAWLTGWLVGARCAGWLAAWLVCWLAGCRLACWCLAGWLAGWRLAGWQASRLAAWLAGCLPKWSMTCLLLLSLACWLASWMGNKAGRHICGGVRAADDLWFAGWLVGLG